MNQPTSLREATELLATHATQLTANANRIAELEASLTTAAQSATAAQALVTDLQAQLTARSGELTAAQAQLNTLQAENATLKASAEATEAKAAHMLASIGVEPVAVRADAGATAEQKPVLKGRELAIASVKIA